MDYTAFGANEWNDGHNMVLPSFYCRTSHFRPQPASSVTIKHPSS